MPILWSKVSLQEYVSKLKVLFSKLHEIASSFFGNQTQYLIQTNTCGKSYLEKGLLYISVKEIHSKIIHETGGWRLWINRVEVIFKMPGTDIELEGYRIRYNHTNVLFHTKKGENKPLHVKFKNNYFKYKTDIITRIGKQAFILLATCFWCPSPWNIGNLIPSSKRHRRQQFAHLTRTVVSIFCYAFMCSNISITLFEYICNAEKYDISRYQMYRNTNSKIIIRQQKW